MVGTYKYNGKVVSEKKFKEKVYGKDSPQAKAARRKEEREKRDRSNAGSKGSNYSKITRRDGSVEIRDERTGQTVETKTPSEAKESERNIIVTGSKRNKDGSVTNVNVGRYLSQEQKRQVADLSAEKGRLKVTELSRTRTGDTVSQRVGFSYNEEVQKSVSRDRNMSVAPVRGRQSLEVRQSREVPLQQSREVQSVAPSRQEFVARPNMIEPAPEPKGFFNRTQTFFDRRQGILESEVQRRDSRQETSFLQGGEQLALGAAEGVFQLGRTVLQPKRTVVGLYNFGRAVVRDPNVAVDTVRGLGESFFRNPARFIGQTAGSFGAGKLVGTVAKAGLARARAPKVTSVSDGTATTTQFADDVTRKTTNQRVNVRSGGQDFEVNVRGIGYQRPDADGARAFSEGTSFDIVKVNRNPSVPVGGSFQGGLLTTGGTTVRQTVATGQSRAAGVAARGDSGRVLARGDFAQSVTQQGRSVARQGRFDALGTADDATSQFTSVSRTGAPFRTRNPDSLDFGNGQRLRVSSVESLGSRRLLQFDAPETSVLNTPSGAVRVTTSQQFPNTLYEVGGQARAGGFLTRADKANDLVVNPYARTARQGGVTLDFGGRPAPAGSARVSSGSSGGGGLGLTVLDDLGRSFKVTVPETARQSRNINVPQFRSNTQIAREAVGDVQGLRTARQASGAQGATSSVGLTNVVAPQNTGSSVPQRSAGVAAVEAQSARASGSQGLILSSPRTPALQSFSRETGQVSQPELETSTVSRNRLFENTQQVARSEVEAVQEPASRSRGRLLIDTRAVQDVGQLPVSRQTPALRQRQVARSVVGSVSRQSPSLTQYVARGVVLPQINVERPTPQNSALFDVFVRRRGKFKSVGQGLTRGQALDLGAFEVSNSPAATFKLQSSQSRSPSLLPSRASGSFNRFSTNFRQRGGLFIERREKRIKSSGEKAGITRKGILANIGKKKRGLF